MQATASTGSQLAPVESNMPAVKHSVMYYFALGAGHGMKNAVASAKNWIIGFAIDVPKMFTLMAMILRVIAVGVFKGVIAVPGILKKIILGYVNGFEIEEGYKGESYLITISIIVFEACFLSWGLLGWLGVQDSLTIGFLISFVLWFFLLIVKPSLIDFLGPGGRVDSLFSRFCCLIYNLIHWAVSCAKSRFMRCVELGKHLSIGGK